jgi:hypothetical protein
VFNSNDLYKFMIAHGASRCFGDVTIKEGVGTAGTGEQRFVGEGSRWGRCVWVERTAKQKNSTGKESNSKRLIREADADDEGPSPRLPRVVSEPPRGLSYSTLGLQADGIEIPL